MVCGYMCELSNLNQDLFSHSSDLFPTDQKVWNVSPLKSVVEIWLLKWNTSIASFKCKSLGDKDDKNVRLVHA